MPIPEFSYPVLLVLASALLPVPAAFAQETSRGWAGELSAYFENDLFARAGGRPVARDIFLDGNTFDGAHSVTRNPWWRIWRLAFR